MVTALLYPHVQRLNLVSAVGLRVANDVQITGSDSPNIIRSPWDQLLMLSRKLNPPSCPVSVMLGQFANMCEQRFGPLPGLA